MKYYYIMAFPNTTAVMQAEARIKNALEITIIPVPCEISSGCGLAIRFLETSEDCILHVLRTVPISGDLYKMETKRLNGKHPIQKLDF